MLPGNRTLPTGVLGVAWVTAVILGSRGGHWLPLPDSQADASPLLIVPGGHRKLLPLGGSQVGARAYLHCPRSGQGLLYLQNPCQGGNSQRMLRKEAAHIQIKSSLSIPDKKAELISSHELISCHENTKITTNWWTAISKKDWNKKDILHSKTKKEPWWDGRRGTFMKIKSQTCWVGHPQNGK